MDPMLLQALCGLLIVISLGIQHALQSGTFPARFHSIEPFRSFVACVPGGLTASILALGSGATWQQALAAGLSGCAGALQGAFAAFWPKASPASSSSGSSGPGTPPATPTLPSAQSGAPLQSPGPAQSKSTPRRSVYAFCASQLARLGARMWVSGEALIVRAGGAS